MNTIETTHRPGTLQNPKNDPRPSNGFWAPGNYITHCRDCNDCFVGDKLAIICADCAYQAKKPKHRSSKQQRAKEKQQYVDKLIPNTCSNCMHFREETKPLDRWMCDAKEQKTRMCALGGFSVLKCGSCSEWAGI